MLQIYLMLDIYRSETVLYPNILQPPTLLIGKARETKSLDGITEIPDKCEYIETVVDFKNINTIISCEDLANEVLKKLSIVLVETDPGKEDSETMCQHMEESLDSCSMFQKPFQSYLHQINQTEQFVFSLRPDSSETVNPLIEYLREHPSAAFKLRFVFEGLENEGVKAVLFNAIEKIEPVFESFKLFLEEIMKNRDEFDDVSVLYNLQKIKSLKEIPYSVKEAINNVSNLIAERNKTGSFEEEMHQRGEENFSTRCSVTSHRIKGTVYGLKTAIVEHFLSELENNLKNLSIPVYHKALISQVFKAHFDNDRDCRTFSLNNIIDTLKEKSIKLSKLITLETQLFKFNSESNTLQKYLMKERGIPHFEFKIKVETEITKHHQYEMRNNLSVETIGKKKTRTMIDIMSAEEEGTLKTVETDKQGGETGDEETGEGETGEGETGEGETGEGETGEGETGEGETGDEETGDEENYERDEKETYSNNLSESIDLERCMSNVVNFISRISQRLLGYRIDDIVELATVSTQSLEIQLAGEILLAPLRASLDEPKKTDKFQQTSPNIMLQPNRIKNNINKTVVWLSGIAPWFLLLFYICYLIDFFYNLK
ncbi:hypothetical protein CDIK_2699 [Cucumispora dikerogammari]|nr:hypothetical protein CDIK_2699 [Cucumispora dikerogammari]